MKIAIIGSRSFFDYELLKSTVNDYRDKNSVVYELMVSGGAGGADRLGERYAKEHDIPTRIFYPDWDKFGKRAGFLRNQDIINNSDLVFAFWDGVSKGTKSSIDLAKQKGSEVVIVLFPTEE